MSSNYFQKYLLISLKPENVLLNKDGYLKLTDFGLCLRQGLPKRKAQCGTAEYMPPEIVLK